MKILSLAALSLVASLNMAYAQTCYTSSMGTTCYDSQAAFNNSYNAASNGFQAGANLRMQGAMINSYREAHGLPRCSVYPIFHWDGLPGC